MNRGYDPVAVLGCLAFSVIAVITLLILLGGALGLSKFLGLVP